MNRNELAALSIFSALGVTSILCVIAGIVIFGQIKTISAQNACFDAAKSSPEKSIHLCKDRAQIVAELVIERDKSEKCDAAISQGYSSGDCTSRVQALALENATQKAKILMLEADQKAAITRAENRNQTQTKKKIQDVKTLEKAKATSIDGNIICDTECLRARFETD